MSQRIPESDGEFSPLLRKKGFKKRRMTTKEPAGITMQDLRGKSQRVDRLRTPDYNSHANHSAKGTFPWARAHDHLGQSDRNVNCHIDIAFS